jgi:putative membrane protein
VTARRLATIAPLALAALFTHGCGDAGHAAPAAKSAATTDTLPRRPAAELSEQTVQGVVDVINATDAQLSGAAATKASSVDVKRFAASLASGHRQRVTDRDLPRADSSALALVAPLTELRTQATARLAAVPAGPAFDRAYVETQVAAHERALALLDRIAPAARAGTLPALVAGTRTEVAQHLAEARALQRRLPP